MFITKCSMISVLLISASAAPFLNQPFMKPPMEQQMIQDQMMNQRPMGQIVTQLPNQQFMMNQMIEQQMMEQLIQQNQYNALQQQLITMQQLHSPYNTLSPIITNLPPQPIILLLPNTRTKTNNHHETLAESDQLNTKIGNGDTDSIVIEAENEANILEVNAFPRRAMVVLPNGQRFFIGSIISAIPFLPFEVNVPDTIAWMYNGISGIIGGIGQRLPFRPKPTETPASTQTQGSMEPSQPSRSNLMQKLMMRKQNMGMPVLMLPVAQAVPIQVPIEV